MNTGVTRPERNQVRAMLQTMGDLQDAHNRQVAPDWRERGFDYYRAVWVECAELLDHFGWKWWKHQQPDLEQVRLEVVDIWHFGLSMLLLEDGLDDTVVDAFCENLGQSRDAALFRGDVEALALAALRDRRFSVPALIDLMNALGMSLPELSAHYVGKNVLNGFRQANGYHDGSYRKSWNGREDNEHLVELVAELDVTADDFAERLRAAIAARYELTRDA